MKRIWDRERNEQGDEFLIIKVKVGLYQLLPQTQGLPQSLIVHTPAGWMQFSLSSWGLAWGLLFQAVVPGVVLSLLCYLFSSAQDGTSCQVGVQVSEPLDKEVVRCCFCPHTIGQGKSHGRPQNQGQCVGLAKLELCVPECLPEWF